MNNVLIIQCERVNFSGVRLIWNLVPLTLYHGPPHLTCQSQSNSLLVSASHRELCPGRDSTVRGTPVTGSWSQKEGGVIDKLPALSAKVHHKSCSNKRPAESVTSGQSLVREER